MSGAGGERSGPQEPVLFVGHGGGPGFFMRVPEGHPMKSIDADSVYPAKMKSCFPELYGGDRRPKAILVVSAHWEGNRAIEVLVRSPSPLLFDYYGFPEECYKYTYNCPTDLSLAATVQNLLESSGITCGRNTERGLDHGVFIPLMLLAPDAGIPVVQLSLHPSLDAELHIRLGEVLSPLRSQGVLILGSGMATHNLSLMRHSTSSDQLEKWAADFHAWLDTTLLNSTPDDRRKRLIAWAQQAPHARKAHPREEHLLPLLVCVGAAGSGAMSKRWAGWPAGHMSLASYSSP